MNYILQMLRLYPELISGLVQIFVYTASGFLFFKGLWLIYRSSRHLRNVSAFELLKKSKEDSYTDDPLIVLTAKTFYAARNENTDKSYPNSFLADATRQLVENLFQINYMSKITMITHLLPPLGFIGTVFGMIMIFMAKADPNSSLNTSGLGAALFTTLFALSAFVVLEMLKIRLNNLSRIRVETGLNTVFEHVDDGKSK